MGIEIPFGNNDCHVHEYTRVYLDASGYRVCPGTLDSLQIAASSSNKPDFDT
jgi:hypothetical protein